MTKKKPPIFSKEEKVAAIHEGGEITREVIRQIGRVGDRVIQASLSSPYYSVSAIALLSAMMVRGKLIPPETSMLVTGTGLTLLGANTIVDTLPLLSGLTKTDTMLDNQYDENPGVSPWAVEPADRYLQTIEQ